MEGIRTTTSEIENLVIVLLVQNERLEENKETDPSKGSIHKTLLTIKQLNKKLEIILGNKETQDD